MWRATADENIRSIQVTSCIILLHFKKNMQLPATFEKMSMFACRGFLFQHFSEQLFSLIRGKSNKNDLECLGGLKETEHVMMEFALLLEQNGLIYHFK